MVWQLIAKRFVVALSTAVLTTAAFGFTLFDGDIKIIKNPNAPVIAIKYSGVNAARAEIRINGVQAGSKDIKSTKNLGIVTFGFSPDRLLQGENLVEAFLYDKTGKMVSSEKLTMAVQKDGKDPVYMRFPKMGQTVQGAVEMSVGFGTEMRDAYVSFFVDKEFRSMKNFPPYSYIWDTTKESNGWHEVEAWTFDAAQTTRRSQPVRVFINNPGGNTPRVMPKTTPKATSNTAPKTAPKTTPKSTPTNTQTNSQAGTITAATPNATAQGENGMKSVAATPVATQNAAVATPTIDPAISTSGVTTPMGKESTAKVADLYAEAAGLRITAPNKAVAKATPKATTVKTTTPVKTTPVKTTPVKTIANPKAAPVRTAIKPGVRLSMEGTFPVYLDGVEIKFDVAPRVTDGVALSPFRHLFEGAGGKVGWKNDEKVATGNGMGYDVYIKIGEDSAKVNGAQFKLDYAAFLERGRTIIPLSFLNAALNFNIEVDQATGHVLITTKPTKN